MEGEWLIPWWPVNDPEDAAAWKLELQRECPVGHVLHGREATFIARRRDRDDFLVRLDEGQVAMVHLTWRQETDPYWPSTTLYQSLSEWRDEVMMPDHEDWTD